MSTAKEKSVMRTLLHCRAAMIVAYDELILGGDWNAARERIKDAEKELRTLISNTYPSDMEPIYLNNPFKETNHGNP